MFIGGLIPAHAGKTHARHREPHQHEAHPRSRGENVFAAPMIVLIRGSSPLTRGKRIRAACPPTATGLIPAHAGKTRPGDRTMRQPRAHPRSRGENVHAPTSAPSGYGSSPLTRGKRSAGLHAGPRRGLIPAHAGKTPSSSPTTRARRAHPRSRGENPGQMGAGIVGAGSSPLTRGKQRAQLGRHFRPGLIPAHAGKT